MTQSAFIGRVCQPQGELRKPPASFFQIAYVWTRNRHVRDVGRGTRPRFCLTCVPATRGRERDTYASVRIITLITVTIMVTAIVEQALLEGEPVKAISYLEPEDPWDSG